MMYIIICCDKNIDISDDKNVDVEYMIKVCFQLISSLNSNSINCYKS